MIGLPEIIVVAVFLLILFGYRYLPRIGRAAGSTLRSGADKARGLSGEAGERVRDKVDPQAIGRSAGRTMREVRETRDAFTGKDSAKDEGTKTG